MDAYAEMKKAVRQRQEESHESFMRNSKMRLSKILSKKILTTGIGAISAIEQAFGYMWGHGKSGRLTADEHDNLKSWNMVRNKILNNSNNQIRALEKELEQYDVEWNRHNANFDVDAEGMNKLIEEFEDVDE